MSTNVMTYAEFLATSTPERRKLAADLEHLHSTVTWNATSDTVVLDLWEELVRFATNGEFTYLDDPTTPVEANDVSNVIEQLHALGGAWVDGDLRAAAYNATPDNVEAHELGPEVMRDAPRWITLKEIEDRTGLRLP